MNSQSKTVNLLSIDGASSVQVLGGTGQNSLSVQSLAGPTDATISGNNVTLVSGSNVLDQTNFGTYNDFSELNQLINFSSLASGSTSYTDPLASGSFTLTACGKTQRPGAQHDHQQRRAGGLALAASTFTLTATPSATSTNFGLFALYGISLNANSTSAQTVTFTGNDGRRRDRDPAVLRPALDRFRVFPVPLHVHGAEVGILDPRDDAGDQHRGDDLFPYVAPGPSPGSVAATSGSADDRSRSISRT